MKPIIPLLIIVLYLHCTHVALRQLSDSSAQEIDCSAPSPTSFSKQRPFIVDSLYRQNAKMSKILRLNANYGTPDKFIQLFKNNNDSALPYLLLFHFRDRYDYDFFIGKMTLKGDMKSIEKIVSVDPASFVIGEAIDHYFFVRLTEPEMRELSFSKSMTGQVGEIGFELPYACREAWRGLLGKE
jgi:hypothetical protein